MCWVPLSNIIPALFVWSATHASLEAKCSGLIELMEAPSGGEPVVYHGLNALVGRTRRKTLRISTLLFLAAVLVVTFLILQCFNAMRANTKFENGTRRLAEAPEAPCYVRVHEKRSLTTTRRFHHCSLVLENNFAQRLC